MIIEIQHETILRYSSSVTEWLTELRVEPFSDNDQSCQTFFLGVSQPTTINRYLDGFGNRVHHFNLMKPNLEVRALSASVIDTHPIIRDVSVSTSLYPLQSEELPLETLDYVSFRGPVNRCEKLDPILVALQPTPKERIIDVVFKVSRFIHSRFTYAKAVTNASSPIDHVLEKGKGVCQDFAHLMIGILRGFKIPARYVSGYIHRPNKESQSHAWCEVWIPDLGWIGIDPTNNKRVDEHFVKVALGRDFTDVPPNKGVYRGEGDEEIFVRVQTRQLERQPTLSWKEQLPELETSLSSVQFHHVDDIGSEEEIQQQQQQQQ